MRCACKLRDCAPCPATTISSALAPLHITSTSHPPPTQYDRFPADVPNLPALAALKAAVLALNPSTSYQYTLTQFLCIELALSQAKVQRASAENRSQPISSLPPEILSHIFQIHRDLHDTFGADISDPRPAYESLTFQRHGEILRSPSPHYGQIFTRHHFTR